MSDDHDISSPKPPHKRKLDLRIELDEWQKIATAAEAAGMTVSAYARARITGKAVRSKTDQNAVATLSKIGGLIKTTWLSRGSSDPLMRARSKLALDALIMASERIAIQPKPKPLSSKRC